jgi:5-methylcytosine-specific restriction enzyme A
VPTAPKTFRPSYAPVADYDAERRRISETRKLYGTARWRAIRAAQLRAEPLCRSCREASRLTPATTCDHVTPHRGNVEAFWAGPFQSLCAPCHSSLKQRLEGQGG